MFKEPLLTLYLLLNTFIHVNMCVYLRKFDFDLT
jgi:hypothetical protein